MPDQRRAAARGAQHLRLRTMPTLVRRTFAAAMLAVVLVLAAGCGGDDATTLTIYSGREEELVAPLFERFTSETGIEVEVRYGDSAELAAALAEEGDGSPADVFFAQDPGALGAVADRLVELPTETLERVDSSYRDAAGRWVGTSGRSRVIVYNTDELSEDDVPDSVFALTEARWRDRVGIAPTNASFQAFVTAMRLSAGEERTRAWLTDLKQNGARAYEKNTPIVEAVATGEIVLGLVNHYYLALVREEQPDAPIANHFLPGDDPGALVSVAGVGVLAATDDRDAADRFVSYLLADEQQRFYTEEAEEAEYPLVAGIPGPTGQPELSSLQGPDVDLAALGAELRATVELLRETGWLT